MPALIVPDADPSLSDPTAFSAKRKSHGASVKDPFPVSWPGTGPITSLYFVYIAVDATQNLVVRQFYDTLGTRTIDEAEIDTFRQAAGGTGSATPKGFNFENLIFKEPCYFTMALDHPTWQFYDYNFPDHDPFIFITRKEKIIGGRELTVSYDPNYSFFDARVKPIPGYAQSSVRCINHFRADLWGRRVANYEVQNYGFEIYIRIPFALRGGGEQYVTILIDPDGQNQGPNTA